MKPQEIDIEKILISHHCIDKKSVYPNCGIIMDRELLDIYTEMIKSRMQNSAGEEYPRKCSVTGAGMSNGFVFGDGDYYACNEFAADMIARKIYAFDGFREMQSAHANPKNEDELNPYWTEWEIDEEDDIFICIAPHLQVQIKQS